MRQKKFLAQHPPITELDDVGNAVRDHLAMKAKNHKIYGQLIDNRLLGVKLSLDHSRIPYTGKSIKTRDWEMLKIGEPDHYSYSGKIWFRLAKEAGVDAHHLFDDSLFHLGGGGYSTWEGPWNEFGKEASRLEQGCPRNLRQPLAAYSFQFQFYISDFPELDQLAIMLKLSDEQLPKKWEYYWVEPDLDANDEKYLEFLRKYREGMYD
jgi:hypothetical protein